MDTKYDEIITRTSNPAEMQGKYLKENLLHKWVEEFIHEDTGEKVSVERTEILMERGTFVDGDVFAKILFYLDSGDIEEVVLTNQYRTAVFEGFSGNYNAWIAVIELAAKKKIFYLYATNILTATNIVQDYVEQKFSGIYRIISLKQSNSTQLVKNLRREYETDAPENEIDKQFYKITLNIINSVGVMYESEFIVKSKDAESGKVAIEDFLKDNKEELVQTSIKTAKTVPCNNIIDIDFCKRHELKYREINAE